MILPNTAYSLQKNSYQMRMLHCKTVELISDATVTLDKSVH